MLSPPIDASPEEVRALLLPLRHDFSVAVETPGNSFAVGAIIRVAHNFLAKEIFLIGEPTFYEKASMGMEKYETVTVCNGITDFLEVTRDRPLVCLEREKATHNIYDIESFPEHCVLVFGSERFGLSEHLLARASMVVGIPQYGVNQSLPLAVASGIAMNEWARRHARTRK